MATSTSDISAVWTALGAGLIVGMMLCSLVTLDALPQPEPCVAEQETTP